MATSILVLIILVWGMSHTVWTLDVDMILHVNASSACTEPVICRIPHTDSSQMTVTWRTNPTDLFAVVKDVQKVQDKLLIHASRSCSQIYTMTDVTTDDSLCSLNCHEFFNKYRYMCIDSLCSSAGAKQCYFDKTAIKKNMTAFVKVISLIIGHQKWNTFIIMATNQVLADVSSSLLSSSYQLVIFDEEARVDESLSDIYTLSKEEDLNFIVICSPFCINMILNQAHVLESGLKKRARVFVVPAGGNVKELSFYKLHIKTTDVAILEVVPCSKYYMVHELDRLLEFPSLVGKGTCAFHFENRTEQLLNRNDVMVSANIYIFHQSRNDTTVMSGGYIDRDENIVLTKELFPGMKYGLNNRILTVALLKWEPFVFKKVESGLVSYSGICLDLLTELGHRLNFSYQFVEPTDQEFGQLVNGRWTGMVGMLFKQEADLILGPIAMDATRNGVVDFTTPYFVDNSAVILKLQDVNTNKWLTLVAPFRYEVYICIFFSFIFSTVLLFVAEEVNPLNKWENNRPSDRRRRYGDILWYHFGALTANGGSYVPKTQSGRSILSCWLLFTVISAAIYSGNLIAFLTDWRENPPFTTLAEMVEQDTYKWGTLGGSNYVNLFQRSTRIVYKKIWKGVVAELTEDPDVLSLDSDVHLRKLLAGHYAYISDLTNLQMWEKEYCGLQLLREVFSVIYLAIGLPKNSSLTDDFSNQILKIRESGLVDLWFKHWMPRNRCDIKKSAKRVELLALQSAFFTAGIGLLLALSILMLEFLYSKISITQLSIPHDLKLR